MGPMELGEQNLENNLIDLRRIKDNFRVGNVGNQETNDVMDDEREIGKIGARRTLQAKLVLNLQRVSSGEVPLGEVG